MMRSDPPPRRDYTSRVLIWSAVVAGLLFWLDEDAARDAAQQQRQLDEEEMSWELERKQLVKDNHALQSDNETLASANTRLASRNQTLREQVGLAERERVDAQSLASQETAWVSTKTPRGDVKSRPKSQTGPRVVKAKLNPVRPATPGLDERSLQPDLSTGEVRKDEVELVALNLDSIEEISVDPGAVAFRSRKDSSSRGKLNLGEDSSLLALAPSSRTLDRTFAYDLWYRTREEASEFECGSLRGASRERCDASLNQILDSHSVAAVDCVISGNASPDYVHGLDSKSLPSHAISMKQGALILCDSALPE